MFHRVNGRLGALLLIFLSFCLQASAVPPPISLGIQRDFPNRGDHILSYSTKVEFFDDSKNENNQYPPDYMSNEKLVKLTSMAYNEMQVVHRGGLTSLQAPQAMTGLAFGKTIYFASSMRKDFRNYYADEERPQILQDAIKTCLDVRQIGHRLGLACSEPNVLDLLYGDTSRGDIPEGARIIAWVKWSSAPVTTNPCSPSGAGYGCKDLVEKFKSLTAIRKGTNPDPGDGSEWQGKFKTYFLRKADGITKDPE